jgi:DNA polymerase-3 subunit epsilon
MPTGNNFHVYLNPERAMPDEAYRIHGLSDAFLSDKPLFFDVADEFLEFIGRSKLVIHNAGFDLSFLNAELKKIGRPSIESARAIDTVILARRKFPGARVSLDDLCRRFEIDLSDREKHGALLDSELLAAVYLELVGGRQPGFELAGPPGNEPSNRDTGDHRAVDGAETRPIRPHEPTPDELRAHDQFLEKIASPIWRR